MSHPVQSDAPDPSRVPWPQFAEAVVELVLDGEHLVLTPDDESDAVRSTALAAHGVPIWVLTAGDPYPLELDERENVARNARLSDDLAGLGVRLDPALGRAHDGSVSERSIAVRDGDRATVLAAAARYGQLAVYEIDDRIRCIDVASGQVVSERAFRVAAAPAGSGRRVGPTGWKG